jgi:hypothetical protein
VDSERQAVDGDGQPVDPIFVQKPILTVMDSQLDGVGQPVDGVGQPVDNGQPVDVDSQRIASG